MSKQSRQTQQQRGKTAVHDIPLAPVIPRELLFAGMLVWCIVVLVNYFGGAGRFPLEPGDLFASLGGAPVRLHPFMAALQRHLLNITAAGALMGACFGFGVSVVRWVFFRGTPATAGGDAGRPDHAETVFYSFALGMGAFALVVFLLGTVGLVQRPVFHVLTVLGLTLAVINRGAVRAVPRSSDGNIAATDILCLAALGVIALFNLIGALTPEIFFDSQVYQLGLPTEWLATGRIRAHLSITQSYFPLSVNMLYLAALGINNEITAKLVHFACGLLIVYGLAAFCARRFGRTVGLLAGLIFYSVPVAMMVSWKTAVELGIGVFELGAVFALAEYLSRGERRWLALAGVLCGFSIGSKYTGIPFCLVPMAVTILWIRLRNRAAAHAVAKDVGFFLLCAAAVSFPWFLRNLVATGNPVFPFFWERIGFARIKTTGSLFVDPPRPPLTFMNTVLFFWPLTMGTLQQESWPGPLFLMMLPLLFLHRRVDPRIRAVGLYLVIAVAAWAVVGRFYVRYFLPAFPLIALATAYFMREVRLGTAFRAVGVFLALLSAYANLCFAKGPYDISQMPLGYVCGAQSEYEYLSLQRPSYPAPYLPALDVANNVVGPGNAVAFLGETRQCYARRRVYTHSVADYNPFIEWVRAAARSPDPVAHLERLLEEHRVTHLLVNLAEAQRIRSYDVLYWEPEELRVFHEFWVRRVRLVHEGYADLADPVRGLHSLRRELPELWRSYTADPMRGVHLYEITRSGNDRRPVPVNPLLNAAVYDPARWERLRETAVALSAVCR